MIVALLNQKGGVGRPRSPPTSPVSWRCAASTSYCWTPTRRLRAGLDAAPQPARFATAVQRRGPRSRNIASGGARTRQAGRSRRHRRPAAHRRLGALRAAGGRARADPRAAQPLRPVGQRRDGGADPRGAGVPACAARGIRHQPARQHHGDRTRSARRSGRAAAPRCARKYASASSSQTAWPPAGLPASWRPTAPPPAKSPRWWTNCCGGHHDHKAVTRQQTRSQARGHWRAPAHESARRSVDSPR